MIINLHPDTSTARYSTVNYSTGVHNLFYSPQFLKVPRPSISSFRNPRLLPRPDETQRILIHWPGSRGCSQSCRKIIWEGESELLILSEGQYRIFSRHDTFAIEKWLCWIDGELHLRSPFKMSSARKWNHKSKVSISSKHKFILYYFFLILILSSRSRRHHHDTHLQLSIQHLRPVHVSAYFI